MRIKIDDLRRVIREEAAAVINERRRQWADPCWCLVCGEQCSMIEDMDGRVIMPYECSNPDCQSNSTDFPVTDPDEQFVDYDPNDVGIR